MNLVQGALGEIDGGVLAPGAYRAVGTQVLRRRREAGGGTQGASLEATRLGGGKLCCHPGVLARTLDHSSPAWIARDVHHGRECQTDAIGSSFRRRHARCALPGCGVEQAGFCQWYRENRAVTVDDIETHEQRDAEARLLDRE